MSDNTNHGGVRLSASAWLGFVCLGMALLIGGCTTGQSRLDVRPGDQVAGEIRGTYARDFELDYLLFVPRDYAARAVKRWPLIMFLHGAGERGTDLNEVKRIGLAKRVESEPDFQFIVVSPQCPPDRWWSPDALVALLDRVIENYRVDPNRVYLTGLSMGGTGTWMLAAEYPDRFAAIAPICGRTLPLRSAPLTDMPVWAFHGDADHVVDVWNSRNQLARLKDQGSTVAKLTIFPGERHNIWGEIYGGSELYEWFLAHRRSDRAE